MGRLHLAVGTRYERDGRTFFVVQVLREGRLLVEDQSGGGQAVVTREELTVAWVRGALRFEVRGSGAQVEGKGRLPTGYTIADFHLVPEAARAETWRRCLTSTRIAYCLTEECNPSTGCCLMGYLTATGHNDRRGRPQVSRGDVVPPGPDLWPPQPKRGSRGRPLGPAQPDRRYRRRARRAAIR